MIFQPHRTKSDWDTKKRVSPGPTANTTPAKCQRFIRVRCRFRLFALANWRPCRRAHSICALMYTSQRALRCRLRLSQQCAGGGGTPFGGPIPGNSPYNQAHPNPESVMRMHTLSTLGGAITQEIATVPSKANEHPEA